MLQPSKPRSTLPASQNMITLLGPSYATSNPTPYLRFWEYSQRCPKFSSLCQPYGKPERNPRFLVWAQSSDDFRGEPEDGKSLCLSLSLGAITLLFRETERDTERERDREIFKQNLLKSLQIQNKRRDLLLSINT